MPDVHSPEIRSKNMAAIRAVNTKPELAIRRYLHAKGYRYRLHAKSILGTPDLVFRKFGVILFIHGCFWHKHDCPLFKWPKTRSDFWKNKLTGNAETDKRNQAILSGTWRVGVLWECALRGKGRRTIEEVVTHISDWLESDTRNLLISGSY